MLVLTRKVTETIVGRMSPEAIAALAAAGRGLDLTIAVTKLAGNRATIGVEAPAALSLVRGELKQKGSTNDERANDANAHDTPSA